MSEKVLTENERFIKKLISTGFTLSTATIILDNLQGNQALIRIIGSQTNFILSDVQVTSFIKALTDSGISNNLAIEITESVQRVELKTPPKIEEVKGLTDSAFTNALISGGLSVAFAKILVNALNEDEKAIELVSRKKRPVMYMTQQDNRVDDIICLPLEGTIYAIDATDRIRIPSETHPNCRCFYIDVVTGANLGQF